MSLVSTKLMSLTNSKSSFSFPKSNRKSTVKKRTVGLTCTLQNKGAIHFPEYMTSYTNMQES